MRFQHIEIHPWRGFRVVHGNWVAAVICNSVDSDTSSNIGEVTTERLMTHLSGRAYFAWNLRVSGAQTATSWYTRRYSRAIRSQLNAFAT